MKSATGTPALLHVFSTFKVGGPQVRFATLANHFGGRFRHTVIAMDGDYGCRERLNSGVHVEFPTLPVKKGHTLANRRLFREFLRSAPPDLLVTYNWGAIEWALANWPRLVRQLHIEDGFGPEEAQRQIPRRVWTRRLALRGSMVVVPSHTLETIALKIWRLAPKSVFYIANGIDCARYIAPAGQSSSPGFPGTGPIIGTVAILRREKNLARLLRAFKLAEERVSCRLVIVGDGPERAGLEALAAELGVRERVFFTGHIPDPAGIYASMDVFALSSDTEQMPYSVIEAMAAGLSVASVDVGDVGRMVAPDNADFIVPLSDERLADALCRLLADAELRQRIGAANRRKAERDYDQSVMFDSYAALFAGDLPPVPSSIPARIAG